LKVTASQQTLSGQRIFIFQFVPVFSQTLQGHRLGTDAVSTPPLATPATDFRFFATELYRRDSHYDGEADSQPDIIA
jgi:hypothetical protein